MFKSFHNITVCIKIVENAGIINCFCVIRTSLHLTSEKISFRFFSVNVTNVYSRVELGRGGGSMG